MAYRYGDRNQCTMFPKSIEEYVTTDDPVRVYDAFVEALKLGELGIVWEEDNVGNSSYDPRSMLKLLVYGYSYGIRSSRKLERALYHNVSFIWLVGGLTPDHKTIARFRKENRPALKNILKQCARLCIKLKLIDGNTLFVDGSKIRANASINNTWTEERCVKSLARIDARIEEILRECETVDNQEQDSPSPVQLTEELTNKEKLKAKIQRVLNELQASGAGSINSTDRDCVKVKGRQGTHAGYNGQIVVDEKHGLIVHSDVVSQSNDYNQFTSQIEQANQTLDKPCETACADAGYADVDDLKKIDDQGITVVVPAQEQAHNRTAGPFDKEHFTYNAVQDCYRCPTGQVLPYAFYDADKNHRVYQIADKTLCRSCPHYGVCTTANSGRRIRRLANEETKEKLRRQYQEKPSQDIYRLRKQKVELPFGHIKRNLGVAAFLLRGIEGVGAEMSLFCSCFNIARMIGIFGVPTLLANIGGQASG